MTWTVFLETDHGPAEAEECVAVQEELHSALGAVVGCPRGSLAVTMTVDEAEPVKAVRSAVALFSSALLGAQVALNSRVTYVESSEGEKLPSGPPVPDLIVPQGLADRFGVTRTWVNQLMLRKGAPDPVPVEGGGSRLRVYQAHQAIEFLRTAVRPQD